MIVQQELLKKIKDFGLNSYEAKIWTALLSRGVSSAGELSDISNVPRSRTYDVLESLEKKGFVIMKLGKPIKYMAIPPTEVIDVIKKKIRDESVRQEATMDELKRSDVLEQLTTLHTNGIDMIEPTELVGMIKNRENIYEYMENMIKKAEKSVYLMTSSEGIVRKMEKLEKSIKKAADKGVSVKVIVPTAKDVERLDKEFKNILEAKSSDVKSRFILVDDTKLLFFITNDKDVHPSYDVAVWVETSFFAESMKGFFENAWKMKK
ncbi:MAG TPA: TrmB family transcriptional regulator [Alphaproteobacteria bacterium]|nr:TrmB family transcriptional regulator [Alphaproteobacteria bacterium]